MSAPSSDKLHARLDSLHTEHRDLDDMLQRMTRDNLSDDLQVKRLKKRKLQLKDSITELETQLRSDSVA